MEGFHGSIGNGGGAGDYSKAVKIKIPPGMKTQQLIIGSGHYHGSPVSPTTFDSYSENLDLNAPLIRYMCSGSPVAGKRALVGDGGFVRRGSLPPLSAVENLIERPPPPAAYGTPVKAVEGEEVLVIDEVPLSGGGKSIPRFSGSDSSSASGSSGKSLFKKEICWSSVDSGNSRYSSKCQFSLGKENLRQTHLNMKNKTEARVCRSYNSPGPSTYGPNSRFLPQVIAPIFAEAVVTPSRTASPTTSRTPTKTASPATIPMTPNKTASPTTSRTPIKAPSLTASRNTLSTAIAWKDWSPQDDSIEVALPCASTGKNPSRESVDAYINLVLSGCTSRRLPVFSEICSE